jgi:hypothetical protein
MRPFKQMDAMGLEFLRGGFGAPRARRAELLRTAQEKLLPAPW